MCARVGEAEYTRDTRVQPGRWDAAANSLPGRRQVSRQGAMTWHCVHHTGICILPVHACPLIARPYTRPCRPCRLPAAASASEVTMLLLAGCLSAHHAIITTDLMESSAPGVVASQWRRSGVRYLLVYSDMQHEYHYTHIAIPLSDRVIRASLGIIE